MSHLEITGIGTAVPQHSICQEDAAEIAKQFQWDERSADAVTKLYRRAGVGTRHSVILQSSTNGESACQSFYPPARSIDDRGPALSARMRQYESTACDIGLNASQKAIAAAGVAARDITHLITVSCTGFSAPGFDIQIMKRLDLQSTVARTHIGFMGCHAMLNALRVADAFAKDENAVVLICAVELCSLHQQYGRKADRIVSNSLFADGGAAIVCRQQSASLDKKLVLIASGSKILPDTPDQMTWRLGDNGFEMTLSSAVPESIRLHLRDWLESWLSQQGVRISDVRHWAVHPGGPRILDAVAASLQLPEAALKASREILHDYGNMSSPTVAFVLDRLGVVHEPDLCVMLGFGPGLTMEASLLR